jgi:FAD binding domain
MTCTASRERCGTSIQGGSVGLIDPSGVPVRVVAGTHDLPTLPCQEPHTFNFGHELRRANAAQRPPRVPTKVQRLGHVVLQTTTYTSALQWYSEFVGQGMGAGLRDAMNLGWKLAGVLHGTLPVTVLDTYEQERKPHARHMIWLALSVGWAMTAGGDLGR